MPIVHKKKTDSTHAPVVDAEVDIGSSVPKSDRYQVPCADLAPGVRAAPVPNLQFRYQMEGAKSVVLVQRPNFENFIFSSTLHQKWRVTKICVCQVFIQEKRLSERTPFRERN